MRSEAECAAFELATIDQLGEDDPRVGYRVACFEACIPRTFWNVRGDDVTYNTAVFSAVVVRYRKRLRRALRRGYSLLFVGDNGVGKTMFSSYLLTQAVKRGFTAYYTTLTQLDADIKRGFRDREADQRLQALLESDFVAIDEVGKETYKRDSFTMSQFEALLKRRYDDGEPVILGSNVAHSDLCKMYGATVESMVDGRYQVVSLEPGDCRREHKAQMKRAMRFGGKGKR
jgi:DNA replication protein DnaC